MTIEELYEMARLDVREVEIYEIDSDEESEKRLFNLVELLIIPRKGKFKEFNIEESIATIRASEKKFHNIEDSEIVNWNLYCENGEFGVKAEVPIKTANSIFIDLFMKDLSKELHFEIADVLEYLNSLID